tara:strand:- start:13370 stop:13786 length:417 start_codon:yes stop_codon:yes gene_type:complete
MRRKRTSPVRTAAVGAGFRSGLEHRVWKDLLKRNQKGIQYESMKIKYTIPLSEHSYTPDVVFPNGIILEIKGRLMKADRDKHRLIKEQHPELDIRFLFQNANNKIRKGSQTTYAQWCDRNDIKWCEKTVPNAWLREVL